ncbi:unnamed protein product [Linum trigynum]|uniref:Uncharacterized protein n=1 Tax=Linum trigynum TaxID=586398 RepID=A0AAV2DFI1_9ROSI
MSKFEELSLRELTRVLKSKLEEVTKDDGTALPSSDSLPPFAAEITTVLLPVAVEEQDATDDGEERAEHLGVEEFGATELPVTDEPSIASNKQQQPQQTTAPLQPPPPSDPAWVTFNDSVGISPQEFVDSLFSTKSLVPVTEIDQELIAFQLHMSTTEVFALIAAPGKHSGEFIARGQAWRTGKNGRACNWKYKKKKPVKLSSKHQGNCSTPLESLKMEPKERATPKTQKGRTRPVETPTYEKWKPKPGPESSCQPRRRVGCSLPVSKAKKKRSKVDGRFGQRRSASPPRNESTKDESGKVSFVESSFGRETGERQSNGV